MNSPTNGPANEKPWLVMLGDDWGYHTSTAQQLALELRREHRILWINSVGMRVPRLTRYDLARLWKKGVGTSPPARQNGVEVRSFRVLPFHHWKWNRAVNRLLIRRRVHELTGALGIDRPVVVCAVPTSVDIALAFSPSFLTYYCLDDFSDFPGVDWHLAAPYEADLVRQADLVLATSPQLLDIPRLQHPGLRLFRHGVDYELFARASSPDAGDIPEQLRNLRRPVIGFTGTLDRRIDLGLLERVADEVEGTLLVVGGAYEDVSGLKARRNVVYSDYVPYFDVYRYLAACDVLLAPYVLGPHTRCLEPQKLREYLATGKPIVATGIPAFRDYGHVVSIAENADAFIRLVREVTQAPEVGRERRMAAARAESWASRADEFRRLVAEAQSAGRPAGASPSDG